MATTREKEQNCIQEFQSAGPYWHLFTPGKTTPIIFGDEEDFTFAMNVTAQSAYNFPNVKILAFALMNNHLHILASGEQSELQEMFTFFRRRLARGFKTRQHDELPESFQPTIKEVADIAALRNTIAYVNRNGYVANPDHTPFSYPWGTGRHYFNAFPHYSIFKAFNTAEKRAMFRGRTPDFLADTKVENGFISPVSYCAIGSGMAMFRDAHHYFSLVSKNVEAYRGIATEIDDDEFLTDSEMFETILRILKERYRLGSTKELSNAQRLDLARSMHYDFRSSNGQIRRILGLSQYEVDQLFPKPSAKGNIKGQIK